MTVVSTVRMLGELDVPGAEFVFWDGEGPVERADEVEFLVLPITMTAPFTLPEMPRLEVIQTISAGVDRIRASVPDGVILCNAGDVHGPAVAEWALAVTLASLRELPRFVRGQDERRWEGGSTDELAGKRVLVIGAGAIGAGIAARMEACDAAVTLVARRARDGVRGTDELRDLLPQADIVIVVVPLTDATTGMVDRDFLAALPDGALVVNGARGPVCDTDALLGELQSGRLRAALDVVDPEPLPPDHPLWEAPNLLITPHVAGHVSSFYTRGSAMLTAQVRRYVAGEGLRNVVSGEY
jgi:phosphoglycerate dehydrogenase-like enzyme